MSAQPPEHSIRPAQSADEAKSIWWPMVQELGWNRSSYDAQTYFSVTNPTTSFLLLHPASSPNPEGCILALIYPNSTGWIGFFILSHSFRGKGLGGALFHAAELKFQEHKVNIVGLDAVSEQVGTYTRRGFVDGGIKIPVMSRKGLREKPIEVTWEFGGEEELHDLRDVDAKEVSQIDFAYTGLDRSDFWASGLLVGRGQAFGYATVSPSGDGDKAGKVTGFIYARRCELGTRIGPLYAETYAQARQLLHKLTNDFAMAEGDFAAEVFGGNEAGRKLFEELGWEYVGVSYHRMWLEGRVPKEQMEGGKGREGMYAIFDAGAG